jgi:hypothetical protein
MHTGGSTGSRVWGLEWSPAQDGWNPRSHVDLSTNLSCHREYRCQQCGPFAGESAPCPESAKQSLVVLVNCNVLTMINGRESCSRPLSGWERSCPLKLGKANARAVASRELGSASLRKLGVASLPELVKPASVGKHSIPCTDRTPRGGRRQRAQTEPLGTWEARFGVPARKAGQPLAGSHNRWRGRIAASEGLIVAWICRSSRQGAKEPWPESSRVRGTWS